MSKFNVTDIDLEEVSFVGKGANQGAHVVLMKRMEGKMPTKEELQKQLDDLQKEHDELEKDHNELKTSGEELQKTHDDLQKAHDELIGKKDDLNKDDLPEAVKAHLKKQDDELKTQSEMIAKMQDDKLQKEWISKAADATLIGAADDVGALLKTVAETSPETAEAIMVLFKAANTKISKGNLFKELGSGGEGGDDGAISELNKKAHDMAKDKGISFEKAFAAVYKSEHKLRKQYQIEQKG